MTLLNQIELVGTQTMPKERPEENGMKPQNGHTESEASIRPDSQDLSYGYFGWKPKWLQGLNKAVGVVVFFSLANGFQSMVVNGLLGVVISTLEKRFDLSSTESSWMASAYEIGSLPVLLILSYLGTR